MSPIQGKFNRKSPVSFYKETNGPIGWFVISQYWVPNKKQRRITHG